MNLGEYIKQKRISSNLNQKQLAELINVHTQQISNFERNKSDVPIHHLNLLIKHLQLNEQVVFNLLFEKIEKKILKEIYKNQHKQNNC